MIHHVGRLALALPELAIALGVIGAALGRLLVARSSGSLLERPRGDLARLELVREGDAARDTRDPPCAECRGVGDCDSEQVG